MPVVRIHRVHGDRDADLPLPGRGTPDSVGLDLCAALEKDLVLDPGDRALVPTGFAVAIPVGYEGQIRPRSGLALRHGVTIPNAPGTVDADYRGELQVILQNSGREPVVLRRAERIAQLVICPVARPTLEEVGSAEELGATGRGSRGFGSSGR